MFNITSGTIILLGGPVRVAATAVLSSSGSVVSAATVRAGGGATLSAEGTLATTGETRIQFADPLTLTGSATVQGTVSVHVRAASASAGASSDLVARGTMTFDGASAFTLEAVLSASGGIIVDADPTALSGQSSMVGTGGLTFDGTPDPLSSDVSMSISVSPVYRLNLPTGEAVFTEDMFFKRFPVATGRSLVITGGAGRLIEYPAQEELAESDAYFLGGYKHQITPSERALIIAAGYGDLITEA